MATKKKHQKSRAIKSKAKAAKVKRAMRKQKPAIITEPAPKPKPEPEPKRATAEQVTEAISKLTSTLQPAGASNLLDIKELPPQAITIRSSIDSIAAQAALIELNDAPSAAQAMEMVTQLATIKKKYEAARTSITKPMLEAKKRVDALFKPGENKLEEADRSLRNKLLKYHEEQRSRVETQRTELIEKAKEAQEQGDVNTAAALAVQATSQEAPLSTTMTSGGYVQQKMRWTFEVEDMGKVPVEYMSLDSTKVNAAIRSGERNIPGLRIFQKAELAVSGTALPESAAIADAPVGQA